jgi:O-antigen ligase
MIYKSGSVAAWISTLILILLSLLIAGWVWWGKNLKRHHYYLFFGAFLLIVVLVVINLDYLLGLFGRSTSLTGRIPMWGYLFEHAVSQRPVLGFGYGAFWNLQGFREQMTAAMHFSLQVTQSDNGFMEILLHLGFVGLALMISLLILGLVRGTRYFLARRTLVSALPILILVFAILANTTVSMLLESDVFVWAVLVTSQVSIGEHPGV